MVYTVMHFKYKDFYGNLALVSNLQTVESPINYMVHMHFCIQLSLVQTDKP